MSWSGSRMPVRIPTEEEILADIQTQLNEIQNIVTSPVIMIKQLDTLETELKSIDVSIKCRQQRYAELRVQYSMQCSALMEYIANLKEKIGTMTQEKSSQLKGKSKEEKNSFKKNAPYVYNPLKNIDTLRYISEFLSPTNRARASSVCTLFRNTLSNLPLNSGILLANKGSFVMKLDGMEISPTLNELNTAFKQAKNSSYFFHSQSTVLNKVPELLNTIVQKRSEMQVEEKKDMTTNMLKSTSSS